MGGPTRRKRLSHKRLRKTACVIISRRHIVCSTGMHHPRRTSFMSHSSRVVKAPNDELPADLVDLTAAIGRLPEVHRQQLEYTLSRVIESTKRRRRILNLVQDALGQLRLDMKYLMFDLEATRRERDEYRRQSEETE